MRNGFLKSFKMLTVVFAIGLLSVMILSCGGSSGGDNGDGGSQSLSVTGTSGNQVNLNGTWGSGCDGDIEDGDSDRSVMTISIKRFIIVSTIPNIRINFLTDRK